MIRKLSTLFVCLALLLAVLCTASCVHEWRDSTDLPTETEVCLLIHHEQAWTHQDYQFNFTRSSEFTARYVYKVFKRGEDTAPVMTFEQDRADLTLADFTTSLNLPPGQWDIFVWQDFRAKSRKPFYNTENFRAVTYNLPYIGDDDMRDAFVGKLSVDVPPTVSSDSKVSAELTMSRPMAKYVFIATDFKKFYNEIIKDSQQMPNGVSSTWEALSLAEQQEILKGYSIVALYPYFMPSVYNMFTGKITDSMKGISYQAEIRPTQGGEAEITMDYVMVNPSATGVQVQLALKSPDGKLNALTGIITVPLLRSQITYVRGEFLTTAEIGRAHV